MHFNNNAHLKKTLIVNHNNKRICFVPNDQIPNMSASDESVFLFVMTPIES